MTKLGIHRAFQDKIKLYPRSGQQSYPVNLIGSGSAHRRRGSQVLSKASVTLRRTLLQDNSCDLRLSSQGQGP